MQGLPTDNLSGSEGAHDDHGPKRCVSCGSHAYRTDRYCARCGDTLFNVCRVCGGTVEHPVAYYCTHCGVALDAGRGEAQSRGKFTRSSLLSGW